MRFVIIMVWLGVCVVSLWCWVPVAFAQRTGFLAPLPADVSSYQELLPPGAVHEGTQVLHKIHSEKENLHLLAGYYYGNPREWKKIYQDNRDVIKNPNRLPVGQTIRIQVGETWRPRFAYQEWFNLATRNGEWKPGQPWQRASKVAVPVTTPAAVTKEAGQGAISVPQTTAQPETAKAPKGQPEVKPAVGEKRAVEVIPTEKAPTATATPAENVPAGVYPIEKARAIKETTEERAKEQAPAF
jgi:hypothetical protein